MVTPRATRDFFSVAPKRVVAFFRCNKEKQRNKGGEPASATHARREPDGRVEELVGCTCSCRFHIEEAKEESPLPLAAASVQARFDDVVAAAELARWAQQPEGGGDGERPAHGSDKEWTRNGGGGGGVGRTLASSCGARIESVSRCKKSRAGREPMGVRRHRKEIPRRGQDIQTGCSGGAAQQRSGAGRSGAAAQREESTSMTVKQTGLAGPGCWNVESRRADERGIFRKSACCR